MTRRDLTPEQQSVQAIHAAIEAARQGLVDPNSAHPHLVFCAVSDEAALYRLAEKLDAAGIRYRPFYEPDRFHQLTAIATEPVFGERRKLFKSLQLVRDKEAAMV